MKKYISLVNGTLIIYFVDDVSVCSSGSSLVLTVKKEGSPIKIYQPNGSYLTTNQLTYHQKHVALSWTKK